MSFLEVKRDGFGVLVLQCDCGAVHRSNVDAMRTTTGTVDAESRALAQFARSHEACELPAAFAVTGRPSRSRLIRELSRRPPAAAPTVLHTLDVALGDYLSDDDEAGQEALRARAWVREALARRVRS